MKYQAKDVHQKSALICTKLKIKRAFVRHSDFQC